MLINMHYTDPEVRRKVAHDLEEAVGSKYDISWPLPNLQSSTAEEFWGWRTSYSFDAEVWTKPRRFGDNHGHALLYFFNRGHFAGGGFAVVVTYSRNRTVTYYRWGKCDHKYESKTIGNCLTRYTCHCGHFYDVDSSD